MPAGREGRCSAVRWIGLATVSSGTNLRSRAPSQPCPRLWGTGNSLSPPPRFTIGDVQAFQEIIRQALAGAVGAVGVAIEADADRAEIGPRLAPFHHQLCRGGALRESGGA